MIAWRGVCGAVFSLVASTAMLLGATNGGTTFTTDSARAAAVAAKPVSVPVVQLGDARNLAYTIADSSRVTIVDFVYTRCATLCSAMGGGYQRLQREVVQRRLNDRVRLLTISFDPTSDTPTRLGAYEMLVHPDTSVWTIATLQDSLQLPSVLSRFGVRVIRDGADGFVHNAALHVVDRRGRLVRIFPIAASNVDSRSGDVAVSNASLDALIDDALTAALSFAGAGDDGRHRSVARSDRPVYEVP